MNIFGFKIGGKVQPTKNSIEPYGCKYADGTVNEPQTPPHPSLSELAKLLIRLYDDDKFMLDPDFYLWSEPKHKDTASLDRVTIVVYHVPLNFISDPAALIIRHGDISATLHSTDMDAVLKARGKAIERKSHRDEAAVMNAAKKIINGPPTQKNELLSKIRRCDLYVSAFRICAELMGMSVKKFYAELKAGNIKSSDLLPKLVAHLKSNYPDEKRALEILNEVEE